MWVSADGGKSGGEACLLQIRESGSVYVEYGQIAAPTRRSPHREQLQRQPQHPTAAPHPTENPNEAATTQSIPAWDGGEGGLQGEREGRLEAEEEDGKEQRRT